MLEERVVTMEKKASNRPSSVPQKQNGSECKKTDNGNQKQFSNKYAKKRENNGSRSYYQDSSPRNPIAPKNRYGVDKRPRPRGGGFPREDVTEEYHLDYGSPLLKGKKVNLNHLLNFSYARSESYEEHPHWFSGTSRGGRRKGGSRISYNKEQFLQANCQFVVKEDGDYTIHNIDPDKLVEWDSVELIKVNGHEVSSCPICLEIPFAAKMTRCGHIYCWPCILHYLALGEKSWRKCPICYESVHDTDLKSVVTQEVHKYQVGETITMSLMRREKGTTYALPKAFWEKREGKIHDYNDNINRTSFLKLLSISEEDVQKFVIEAEREVLELKLKEAETSEVAFIDSALHMLKTRELSTGGSTSSSNRSSESDSPKPELPEPSVILPTRLPSTKLKSYASAFSDEEEEMEESVDKMPSPEISENNVKTVLDRSISPTEPVEIQSNRDPSPPLEPIAIAAKSDSVPGEDRNISPVEPIAIAAKSESEPGEDLASMCGSPKDPRQSPPVDVMPDGLPVEEAAAHLEMPLITDDQQNKKRQFTDDAFYFYQASDGQHIYLHALNARCLVKEYGSLANCPDTITANIIQMENVFMSEELRKRLRYLGHLPLTCEFEVAELTLKPPVLSKETLKFFTDEIDKRRRLRQKKNREEKRWTRKVQDEENKKMAKYNIYGTDSRIVQSQFMSSVVSENRPTSPTARSDDSSHSVSSSVNTPVGSPLGSVISEDADGGQTSGLSFAQMLKAGSSKTPTWSKAKSKPENPLPSSLSRSKDSEDSDNDDKVPIPIFRESFGDAIQTALETHMAKSKDDGTTETTEKSGGKKKKKQQKLLLFTTSMTRGGK